MANKIYLVSKSASEIVTNTGMEYAYVMGVELRDGTSGAVVPAKFLQTDECVAAFVGVMPYGGLMLTTVNTDTSDEIVITAHPLSEADSTNDVSVTLAVSALLDIEVGEEVAAPNL